jgi:hypothetical protein
VNIGPAEMVVIGIVWLVPLALAIWAIVDAASRPAAAWDAIGSSRGVWIALLVIFTVFCNLVGLVLSIVYLTSVRRRLIAAGG